MDGFLQIAPGIDQLMGPFATESVLNEKIGFAITNVAGRSS